MFTKVLVANRGEIARRVLRSCHRLGIATVAVHSDADAAEPHVREAGEAVRLGPAPAADSYLDIDRVVDAAKRTGSQAVHPGYGFLSENAAFAEAVAAAGIVFVGPRPDTIRLMGDKAAAKRRLAAAGVPVVPGIDDGDLDDHALAAAAGDVGFPLLVKAVAGGGGKGMRTVQAPDQLTAALAAARREAAGAFGDDRLLLERLIEDPRHVEVQVLGDSHGHVVHVLERECSVQRRHQKIVEETPSPAVDDQLRERMGTTAVSAAHEVGYLGAGTIEFLLAPSGEFFFLEMNTRLQVEHPVTEMVTGLDLVELQLRVAAGEPLGLRQADVRAEGHALEARLYAEDAAAGFLPQTGHVHRFAVPWGPGVRVDAGIEDGSEVTRFYDPMLAKLIVHARDRRTSVERMQAVLADTAVLGVVTNLDHLAAVVAHPAFVAGDVTTAFLERHLGSWEPGPAPDEVVVAATVALARWHERRADAGRRDPWSDVGPWRTGRIGGWRVSLRDGDRQHVAVLTGRIGERRLVLDGRPVAVTPLEDGPGGATRLEIDGHDVPVHTAVDTDVHGEPRAVWVHAAGANRRVDVVPATRHADASAVGGATAFTSPMPGAVIAVPVTPGQRVPAGTTLVVIEAMKMEHPVTAPADGTVTAVHVSAGVAVDAGTVLLAFEPDPEPPSAG